MPKTPQDTAHCLKAPHRPYLTHMDTWTQKGSLGLVLCFLGFTWVPCHCPFSHPRCFHVWGLLGFTWLPQEDCKESEGTVQSQRSILSSTGYSLDERMNEWMNRSMNKWKRKGKGEIKGGEADLLDSWEWSGVKEWGLFCSLLGAQDLSSSWPALSWVESRGSLLPSNVFPDIPFTRDDS